MVTVWNVSPYPQVLDWADPAVLPGQSVEVSEELAGGLSPVDWSRTAPQADSDEVVAAATAKRHKTTNAIKNDEAPSADPAPAPEEGN